MRQDKVFRDGEGVTCNAISHPSNVIDMSPLVAAAVSELVP